MNKIGREVTPHEAEVMATIGLSKMRKSSNAYALFFEDGKFGWSRDNSSRYARWKRTGEPLMIGLYNHHCHMPVIAGDILYMAGE